MHVAAVHMVFFEIVKLLVEHGVNVNARDGADMTPLHYAAKGNVFKTVKLLVEHGADVNAQDGNGMTPLHYAAMGKVFKTVKLLVDHGANVNARDGEGNTALHYGAIGQSGEVLKPLIPDAKHAGELERAFAAILAQISLAASVVASKPPAWWPERWSFLELLVSHSEDINATNNDGLTPLTLAGRTRNMWAAAFLIGKGADVNVPESKGGNIVGLMDRLMNIRETEEPTYIHVSVGWRTPTGTVSDIPGGPSFPSTSAAEIYEESPALRFGGSWGKEGWLFEAGAELRLPTRLTNTGKILAGLTPQDDLSMDGMLLYFFAGRSLSHPGTRLRPFVGLSAGAAAMAIRVKGAEENFGGGVRFELAARAGIDWRMENPSDLTLKLNFRYPLLGLGASIPDEVILYLGVSWWN